MAALTLTEGPNDRAPAQVTHSHSLSERSLREIAMSMHPGTAVANFLASRDAETSASECAMSRLVAYTETHLVPYYRSPWPKEMPISPRIIHHKCLGSSPL